MHTFKRPLVILMFIFSLTEIKAQDPQFSMFYAVPLYINPAFAGSRHANRAILHYRWQWPNQSGRFYTAMASFDTYSVKYRSGIGAYVMQDYQGGNRIISTQFMVQYAYELRINSNHTLRFGLQGGFIQSSLNYGNLPSDCSDGGCDQAKNSLPPIFSPDISAGVLWYAKRFYASVSANHLNRPNYSFVPTKYSPLPVKFTFTAGYKIPLVLHPDANGVHSHNPVMMALTPTITYKKQFGSSDLSYLQGGGSGDQVDLGLYFTYKWLITGVWYRGIPFIVTKDPNGTVYPNNESVVLLVGASYLGFGFGYAYDLTVSTQGINTGGAHEINLSFVFRTKNTKKPIKSLPCPDFEYDILRRGSAGRVR